MNRQTRSVLVIDDEALIRMNLSAFLEDEGFLAIEAASAAEASAALRHHSVDVAIVDLRMAGDDGAQWVREALRHFPELQVFIHTGSHEFQLSDDLRAAGLCERDIWLKPVADMRQLSRAISTRFACTCELEFI